MENEGDFEVEYAKSGRSKCKGCKIQIQNASIRIGIRKMWEDSVVLSWYHPDCWKKTTKRSKKAPMPKKAVLVEGFDNLSEPDQERMVVLIEEDDDWPETEKEDGGSSSDGKSKLPVKPAVKSKPKPKGRSSGRASTKRKHSSSGSGSGGSESEDSMDHSSQGSSQEESVAEDDDGAWAPGGGSGGGSRKKASAAKKKTTKKSSKTAKISGTPVTAENNRKIQEAKEDLTGETVASLKKMLQANNQLCSGTKPDLLDRVASGMVLGAIPTCDACGGGKLRFDPKAGVYQCPGYMDDDHFVRCSFRGSDEDVKRTAWADA
eukprot:Filipodium_phascolosomae@DN7070_c0_g1_i1.p1